MSRDQETIIYKVWVDDLEGNHSVLAGVKVSSKALRSLLKSMLGKNSRDCRIFMRELKVANSYTADSDRFALTAQRYVKALNTITWLKTPPYSS